jgi:TonB family protein
MSRRRLQALFVATNARQTDSLALATMLTALLLVLVVPGVQSALRAQQESEPKTTAPRLIHKVEPEYTAEAREAGLEGTVVLGVEVGTDGTAHDIRVTRSLGMGLDEKGVEAVRLWKFEPATRDGKPVAVKATIEINFRPPGLPADRGKDADKKN